jgi:aspartate racemase
MKTIGMIGGMSWESSAEYYRVLNTRTRERLGGLHSAACILFSVDFAAIEALQRRGDWAAATRVMVAAAQAVARAGADLLLICTNTMHLMADAVQAAVDIPLLHIADATAGRVLARGFTRIGLLGTRFTMEKDFYRGRLAQKYGLEVLVPPAADRRLVDAVIFEELCRGRILPASKAAYLRIIDDLLQAGAQGIILGCTEIGLLVAQADTAAPLFDTARIHAEAAVDFAIDGPSGG